MSGIMLTAQQPVGRRTVLQAGAAGLLGVSTLDIAACRARAAASGAEVPEPRSVIFLFLTGGASQHDTFDMKPDGPADFKGEFNPIATRTPGVQICEHMPMLAERSDKWALVRSLTHANNGHGQATYLMLTGRSGVPPTFRANKPQSVDHPSIAALVGSATTGRNGLPASAVLPEKLYHSNSGIYSGQFAGMLGIEHEPWFIEATDKPHAYHSYSGAFPEYLFDLHKGEPSDKRDWRFEVPNMTSPVDVAPGRFDDRLALLRNVDGGPVAAESGYARLRTAALDMLADPRVRAAVDVRSADPRVLERYGDNSFGWSLLMARRLVEAGVNMVQVNMGNFGSWDLHGNNFPCLKNYLFPPTDRAVSALLDDLEESGLLENTMVVMAGEFGRTPEISHIARNIYKTAGRGHWGPVQTAWFAGGGVRGGTVIGASDEAGAYPAADPQKPENFAATIYHALGIPRDAEWHDITGRPYPLYMANPIEGLFA